MDFESKKIWRYGDDVDTDVIIPARYLAIADWNELAEHAMEDIDTTFAPNVKAGEIMVAGKNFGCGSSREHAPGVIKAKGVPVIVAHSFARIFFRNAINIGLPVVEIGEQVDRIDAGDAIGADLSKFATGIPTFAPICAPNFSSKNCVIFVVVVLPFVPLIQIFCPAKSLK